jgi:hypothetical protein
MRAVVLGSVLLVPALAGATPATVVARLAVDVDGDGRPDEVALSAAGVLTLGAVTLALGGPTPAATLRAARLGGGPAIVIEVARDGGGEAIVVAPGPGGRWREVVRSPIGGDDLDRDFGLALDVTPAGVIRDQTRAGIRRCDGQPAYLFAEGFDPARGVFRPIAPPIGVAADAPTVAATLDPTAPPPPIVFTARAASTQPGASDAGALAIPRELDDGQLETGWREDRGGSGRGQFFTFEARVAGARATELRITPGDPRSPATRARANRPRRLAVVGAEGAAWITLPDPLRAPLGASYVATLPTPLTGCVTVILDQVYPGAATVDETAIAELEIFVAGERGGGGDAVLADAVADDAPGAATAAATLAHRGAAGARALAEALAAAGDDPARRRLIRALVALRVPEAAAPLRAAIAAPWLRGADLGAVIGALGALGAVDVLADTARRGELADDVRVAAVRAIGAATPTGRAALIVLAGAGPRPLRRAVIEALAAAPAAELVAAARAAPAPPVAGDLWRAATLRGRATAGDRAAVLAALAAALPAATDYERRARLLAGLATLGGDAELAAVEAALRALPHDDGDGAALRQVVARAIAGAPRPAAMPILIALARDADPGVRLAALDGLAEAPDGGPGGPWRAEDGPDGVDRVLVTALSTDAWPELRRRAAVALGGRCARPGPVRALDAAVRADRELAVRGEALAALASCRAPTTAALLIAIWDDTRAPRELRERAVDLAVVLGDAALGPPLTTHLAGWRAAAVGDEVALALAEHAATALGRLAPSGAAAALLDMLGDGAYPELVAAAAAGLGELGPACPAAAAAALASLTRSDDRTIAIAARRAAGRCGTTRRDPPSEP